VDIPRAGVRDFRGGQDLNAHAETLRVAAHMVECRVLELREGLAAVQQDK